MANRTATESTEYLFVDGASFRACLEEVGSVYCDQPVEVDWRQLVERFDKTFYYDAVPLAADSRARPGDAERQAKQESFLDALRDVPGVHVYEGDARRVRKGALEQKKVDVQIAVDMLTHSFRRNMQRCTLFTGDLDFKPLVDALVHDGMYVTLWYPAGHTSRELKNAADTHRRLTLSDLARACQQVVIPPDQLVHLNNHDEFDVIAECGDEKKRVIKVVQSENGYHAFMPFVSGIDKVFGFKTLPKLRLFLLYEHGVRLPEIDGHG